LIVKFENFRGLKYGSSGEALEYCPQSDKKNDAYDGPKYDGGNPGFQFNKQVGEGLDSRQGTP